MGNSEIKTDAIQVGINIKDFKLEHIIGRGGFGKVWQVCFRNSQRKFAMKEMLKSRIVKKKSVLAVLNEKSLLSMLKHPFIVNMQFAFNDYLKLYLVMDLMPGGDLRYHLIKHKEFTEQQTKFFVACTIMGLEFLHVNGIIHRDIKPENLVFDSKGYLRITDFGIAHALDRDNSRDSSGTPGYMSPEVMNRKSHSIEADYFALGVIAYECMKGRRPYYGRNRSEIKDQMSVRQASLKRSDVPVGWTLEAADFINKLLQRNPKERLGARGIQELKNHAWMVDVEWKKLLEKTLVAPFKIDSVENLDQKILCEWEDAEDADVDVSSIQSFFSGYHFQGNLSSQGLDSTLGKASRG